MRGLVAVASRVQACRPAAARIRVAISRGWLTSERCPAATSIVVAFMRVAMKRSKFGSIVRSCVDTAYHEGFRRHAAIDVCALAAAATAENVRLFIVSTLSVAKILYRPLAENRCTTNDASLWKVIGQRAVLRPAIIPKGNVAVLPTPTYLKLRLRHMVEQES